MSRREGKRIKKEDIINEKITPKDKIKNKKPKKKRVWKKVLLVTFILLIILAGFVTYSTIRNGGGLQGFLATMIGHNNQTLKDMPEIRFLILGESTGLTDTIMVGSYDPKTQNASMLSIPRDTFIGKNENKATGSDKINAVYRGKNSDEILETVNELTGLNLEYYVSVDTKALKELVDAIGGVDFYVPIDMNYDDTSKENYLRIHLKQGWQKLNGSQAEQVVRFRHNNNGTTYPSDYGEEDVGRMRTQREFITAAMKQTLKPGNIFKIGEFIDIATKHVKTNIPTNVLKDYIPYAVNFNVENIKSGTLPGEDKKLNGVWIHLQDKTKTQIIVNNLFFGGNTNVETGSPEEETDKITIQVLNGTTDFTKLEKVVNKLNEQGYLVTKAGNTTSTAKTSIVNRTKQSSDIADKLKSDFGLGTISSGKDTEKVDFTIIIGKDYK